jgi:hypothetical protein
MCLYPKIIKNKKYQINKKNNGNIPAYKDERTLYVTVGCGKCIECTKKKSRDWKIRLNEEIRTNNNAKFVTLTFNQPSLNKFRSEIKAPPELIDNEIATKATRLFLERWRKKYRTSIKHWLVTELGHTNTERIHLHGIIFTDKPDEIKKIWSYGFVYIGNFVNEITINYIMKYVTKIDVAHKWFQSIILTSPGIGAKYTSRLDANKNAYNTIDSTKTNEMYHTRNGIKLPIPIYYRNKIYTEEERENLWIDKLNTETRYILGHKIDVSTKDGQIEYEKLLKWQQARNERLGYKKPTWDEKKYKKDCRNIKKITKFRKNNT